MSSEGQKCLLVAQLTSQEVLHALAPGAPEVQVLASTLNYTALLPKPPPPHRTPSLPPPQITGLLPYTVLVAHTHHGFPTNEQDTEGEGRSFPPP